ncbi:Eco29kI family restriction endonuclease [Streptomyces sp. NPDC057565]|uniref:Eco29kI family restriction endonuclease n=1 Tax=Streptomyces sp. NPDC057565 TaxID=3346169 RepID=UPI00368702BF
MSQEVMTAAYTPKSFDPLSTEQISHTICETFERQPLVSMLHEIPRFDGAGLYALYYRGEEVSLYLPLNSLQIPVYVGQGRSSNSATGAKASARCPVYDRLRKHRRSIEEAKLPLEEFRFRALLLPDVHANLGENGLRVGYQPVWNHTLTGFGGNEQGSTTRQSKKSKWDTVHDGRSRTHGGVVHEANKLLATAKVHIAQQVVSYNELPWHHPDTDTYEDLDG